MDNKIVLRLTRGGESVFNKTFTKNDFSSVFCLLHRVQIPKFNRSLVFLHVVGQSSQSFQTGVGAITFFFVFIVPMQETDDITNGL